LILATPLRRNLSLAAAAVLTRFGFVRKRLMMRAAMLDGNYPRTSPIISSSKYSSSAATSLIGHRAPDASISINGQTKRPFDFVFPNAALVLFDDGRLPRWDLDEIRSALPATATPVKVVKVLSHEVAAGDDAWRDAGGELFKNWKIEIATAALIRPDGHIGWIAERPSLHELQNGVCRALGG
jgi:hypothetical protein